jgi:hypothetical protein
VNLKRYKTGDRVLLKDHRPTQRGTKKLVDPWQGPYYVIDVMSDVNFRINKEQNDKPRIVHHDRLRPYNTREEHIVPDWVYAQSKLGRKPPGKTCDETTQTETQPRDSQTNAEDNLSSPTQITSKSEEEEATRQQTPMDDEQLPVTSSPQEPAQLTPPRPEPESDDRKPAPRRSKRTWKPRNLEAISDSPLKAKSSKRDTTKKKRAAHKRKNTDTSNDRLVEKAPKLTQTLSQPTEAPTARRKRGRPRKIKPITE